MDGSDALGKWREGEFDLILLDVQMPGMDGFEATCRIPSEESSCRKRTPVLAMTARAVSDDRELCLEAGMDVTFQSPLVEKRSNRLLRLTQRERLNREMHNAPIKFLFSS